MRSLVIFSLALLSLVNAVSSTIIWTWTASTNCGATNGAPGNMFYYQNYPPSFCVNTNGPSFDSNSEGLLAEAGNANSIFVGCAAGTDTLSVWNTGGNTASFANMCMNSAEATMTTYSGADGSCITPMNAGKTAPQAIGQIQSFMIDCNGAAQMAQLSLALLFALVGFNFFAQKL